MALPSIYMDLCGQKYGKKNNTIFHEIAFEGAFSILERIYNSLDNDKELHPILRLVNEDGHTCMHVVAQNQSHSNAEWYISLMEVMGADINAQKLDTGDTVLHIAVAQRDYELVDELLTRYVLNQDLKNKAGLTPYELALEKNDQEMINIFKLIYSENKSSEK